MSDTDLSRILRDSVSRLFSEQMRPEFHHDITDKQWNKLWTMSEELCLTQVVLPEEVGGVGGSWRDAYEIVKLCGEYAVPFPIPETLAARWLLHRVGMDAPDGVLTLVDTQKPFDHIPWARHATGACAVEHYQGERLLRVFWLENARIEHGQNLAGEPRDGFSVSDVRTREIPVTLDARTVRVLGAMLRSAQIAGAASRLFQLTRQYVNDRVQFGRPLIRFQVVQHQLAELATNTASVDAVARAAFSSVDEYGIDDKQQRSQTRIAAAKCYASGAADIIAGGAHQLHGAMGFTDEYPLHHSTRRLWSWRAEYGGAGYWADWLGKRALAYGARATWENMIAEE